MTVAIIFTIAITSMLCAVIAILYANAPKSVPMVVDLRNQKERDQYWINQKERDQYWINEAARQKAKKIEVDLMVQRKKENIEKLYSIEQDILNNLELKARKGDLFAFEQWKKLSKIDEMKKNNSSSKKA